MQVQYTAADVRRFWSKVDASGECWLWIAGFSNGYGQFSLNCENIGAHVFSWVLHYGPLAPGDFVCHNCPGGDNRACVRPTHLFRGDAVINMQDMAAKGRAAAGDRNGARLHPERLARGDRNGRRLHPERYTHLRIPPMPGVTHPKAKLTDDQVREIRRMWAKGGVTQSALGLRFGVSQVKISQIVREKVWKHLL